MANFQDADAVHCGGDEFALKAGDDKGSDSGSSGALMSILARVQAGYAAALLAGAGASLAVAASEASSSAISARFSSSSVSCGKASPRRALKPGSQPETSATVRRSSASSTSKRPSAEFEAGDKAERGHVLFVSDGVG